MLQTKRGSILIETLAVLLGMMFIVSIVGVGLDKITDYKQVKTVEAQLNNLMNAIITHYHDTIRRAENTDVTTSTTLVIYTPVGHSPWSYMGNVPRAVSGNRIRVFSKIAMEKMLDYGCSLISDNTRTFGGRYEYFDFTISCTDNYNNQIIYTASSFRGPQFTQESIPPTSATGLAWNPNTPVTITLRSPGKDRISATGDDITVSWSTARLDDYYRWKSIKKAIRIGRAISNFQKQWMDYEVNYLTHLNSLRSIDDIRIPWEIMLYTPNTTSNPDIHCQITNTVSCRPTLSCVCPYSGSTWWGGWMLLNTYRDRTFFYARNLIPNLGLNENRNWFAKSDYNYWHDSFGMRVGVDLIGAYERGLLRSNVPVPRDNYVPPYSPPFVSYVKTKFGLKLPVVSGN